MLELARVEQTGHAAVDVLVMIRLVEVPEWEPLVMRAFGLLEPETLMGRLVVGHGDLHELNVLRRAAGAPGSPLMVIDFDRVMKLPAGMDLGAMMVDCCLIPGNSYPPLEHRREAVAAYKKALGEEVVAKLGRVEESD